MREIKFRGKRIDNGKWVVTEQEGDNEVYYLYDYDFTEIISNIYENSKLLT